MSAQYKGPLHQTVSTTPTDFWNDSCAISELRYAMEHGAVGATTNPTIVLEVLKLEMEQWRGPINRTISQNPTWSETDVAWELIEQMAVRAAQLLLPVFQKEQGRKGRLSIQTNPQFYRNAKALADQARHFASLAPNMQVKIPATQAGIEAIEDATAAGVSINATVSFTVSQCIAVAEAVERGLQRRIASGADVSSMSPVCTLMVGRLDDWLKVVAARDGIIVAPGVLDWAGIAAVKRAANLFRERGYTTRMLAAAYRHHLHWSELIGGDIVLTIPASWQRRFNGSDVEVKPRFQDPVPPEVLAALQRHFPDFIRAYEPQGLALEEFDSFGASARTLRTFLASYQELLALVRDFMIPNPDSRS